MWKNQVKNQNKRKIIFFRLLWKIPTRLWSEVRQPHAQAHVRGRLLLNYHVQGIGCKTGILSGCNRDIHKGTWLMPNHWQRNILRIIKQWILMKYHNHINWEKNLYLVATWRTLDLQLCSCLPLFLPMTLMPCQGSDLPRWYRHPTGDIQFKNICSKIGKRIW